MSRRVSNWFNIAQGGAQRRAEMYRRMKEREDSRIYVVLACNGEKMDERNVKMLALEEDLFGRDLVTFLCPVCNEKHQSFRVS